MEDKLKTIKLNTSTTMSLFGHLNQNGHFLFLSSSEVYSGSTKSPYSELEIGTTNTVHPRACYIEAKRCGETICNVQRDNGIAASSARLALAYGPGTRRDDKRVINSFIQRALTESQIKLQDMGRAYRTYCYITDAIELLFNILLKGNAPIYNVGGKSRTSIKDLANCIAEHAGVPVLLPDDAQSIIGSPDDVHLDMTLAENEFGKDRYVGLEVGVARTIEWQRVLYNQALIGR
jgi:nucleoside-diphosphate-sugar epimerase